MKRTLKKILINIVGIIPKNSKKIIFESHSDFTDNSRALYDVLKTDLSFKFIWMVEQPNKFKNTKNTIFLNINNQFNIKNIYHLVTSKYIFYTHRDFLFTNVKKQVVVNLTHGIGIKNVKGKLPENFSYVLSCSDNITGITCDQYNCDASKTVALGLPRNDLLFASQMEVQKLIGKFDKTILWLPTFRKHKNEVDNKENDNIFLIFNDEELLEINNMLVEKNYLLLLKIHPAQKISDNITSIYSNIIVLTNRDLENEGIEFYKLIGASDALLTDYSSVGNDYLLLNRPIGYVLGDVEEYSTSKGFAIKNYNDYLPGMHINNKNDFLQFIYNIENGIDIYKDDRIKTRDFYWKYADNHNCERVINFFIKGNKL